MLYDFFLKVRLRRADAAALASKWTLG